MRNLFFAFCLLSILPASAQDTTVFAPPGATWYYRSWTPGPDTGLYTFTVMGDTLLDGWNARILRCSVWDYQTGMFQEAAGLNKYVATTGNKVYYRVADEFVPLFDFGAQPGTVINSKAEDFPIFNGCLYPQGSDVVEFRYRIDSVSSILIDGQNLRVQFVTNLIDNNLDVPWGINGSGRIIERIGPENAGYLWGNGLVCILAGFPGYLRCYYDGDLHYPNPLAGSQACAPSSTGAPVISELHLVPNPAAVWVQFPFIPGQIRLFDAFGQNVAAPTTGALLDVSALPPGIYHVWAEHEGKQYAGKLVLAK